MKFESCYVQKFKMSQFSEITVNQNICTRVSPKKQQEMLKFEKFQEHSKIQNNLDIVRYFVWIFKFCLKDCAFCAFCAF